LRTPISPQVTINEADTRILGVVAQGNTTTLVTYGEAGDTNRLALDFKSAPLDAPASPDGTAFQVDDKSVASPIINITFPAAGVSQLVWKWPGKTFRLLAMSKETADKTWFVDSTAGKQIVIGASYLGEFTLDQSGAPQMTIDTPWDQTPPDEVLVYGTADDPAHVKVPAPPDAATPFLPTDRWEMALDNTTLSPVVDENGWSTQPDGNPPELGQDGDGSAYAWYRVPFTAGDDAGPGTYSFAKIGDNASFYLDGKLVGTFDAKHNSGGYKVSFAASPGSHELAVFVSHSGRNKIWNYIGNLNNFDAKKGLVGPVKSPKGDRIAGWEMKGGEDPADPSLSWGPTANAQGVPAFYRTHIELKSPPSPGTVYRFVTTGLSRGSIWLNGHNLGRYPEVLKGCPGIWLPSCWMTAGANTLVVFDEEGAAIDQTSIQLEPAMSRTTLSIP
jgi:beta-galactosidase